MKRNTKIFWRTVYISAVIITCIYILVAGIGESYKQMRRIGSLANKVAVEIFDGDFSILDFFI